MSRTSLLLAAVVAVALAPASVAQTWDWPAEMSLGGFSVTGIHGNVNPDGSGSATGSVQIPGVPGQKVALTRSARGDIFGNVSMAARVSGAEIQGAFALDAGGLRSRGAVIKLVPRSVIEAVIAVSTGGQFTGTGRVALGNISMPVKYAISRESFSLDGSTTVCAQADTPLATYTFSGDMKLDAGGARIWLTAKGSVQRTGKLSNQVSTTRVSDVQVNVMEGTGTVSVEGVAVTFIFFKP
jgi:hypothetical protein